MHLSRSCTPPLPRIKVLEARVDAVLCGPEAFGLGSPYELISLTPPYEEVVYTELIGMVAEP